MRQSLVPRPTASPAFVTAISGVFQAVLLASLLLMPSVFGGLHRYGSFDLVLGVGLLLAFWVVSSLWGLPLRYVRAAGNPFLWLLLGLLFLQTIPLPKVGPVGQTIRSLQLPTDAFVNGGFEGDAPHRARFSVDRYSLRPASSLGVLVLAAGAVGLYWVVGSTLVGRKAIFRTLWAVVGGAALLAIWMIASGLRGRGLSPGDVFQPPMGVPIWGGDSLVPAFLAALPLAVALVLRPLGWMPHQPPRRRQSRWGWLGRSSAGWAFFAVPLILVAAAAVGASNVPLPWGLGLAILPVAFVLVGYSLSDGPGRGGRRRAVVLVILILLGVAVGVWAGAALRGPALPVTDSMDARLGALQTALTPTRSLLGIGVGAVSPSDVFGGPAWSAIAVADVDVDGYRVLRVEIGSAGLVLVCLAVAALILSEVRAIGRAHSPWTRLAPWAALGAVVTNALYFRFDASALLAPNLLVLAAVLGVATAWRGHGILWRSDRLKDLGPAHWAFVGGAMALLAAMAVAESDMIAGIGPDFQDKVLHCGTFAILCALFCYALGPEPSPRYLRTHVFLSVLTAVILGVLVEFAQACFAASRSFELTDMLASGGGAVAMGLVWWVFRRGQLSPPAWSDA